MKKRFVALLASMLLVAACNEMPPEARGTTQWQKRWVANDFAVNIYDGEVEWSGNLADLPDPRVIPSVNGGGVGNY